MKNYLKIISWFLLSISSMVAKAQPLDTLIKEAISNNLELKILYTDYLAALEKAPQVSQLPDLEAGLGLFPLPVETRLGPQVVRLSAAQMFPWFGTLDSKKELELSKAKALYERIAARSLDFSFEIKRAYLGLYEIEKSQSILQRNISILEALERLALAKVESGKSNLADVLRVQLKTQELKNELKVLETTKISPQVEINQLLNRSLDTKVSVSGDLQFTPLVFKKDSLFSNIQMHHPMLKMFELQQEVSRNAIEVNKLNGRPSFGAGLDYIFVDSRTDADPSGNGRDILQVKAIVKIPLYRKSYEAKEREENLIIESLNTRKEDLLSKFSAEIEKAYANHESARLKYELFEQQIELTKATINILEADYSANGNNFDELLRLEKELIDYDLKQLQAIVQSHLARFSIEKYIIN